MIAASTGLLIDASDLLPRPPVEGRGLNSLTPMPEAVVAVRVTPG